MQSVNIKKDLIQLSKSMKSFTEEEALVQLFSKYKRLGYDTSLLVKFREKYKDTIRYIRKTEFIVDPQDYIDYKNKIIKKLVLSKELKNHIQSNKK